MMSEEECFADDPGTSCDEHNRPIDECIGRKHARILELERVLANLVARIKEVGEASLSVFQLAAAHGMPYKGPTCEAELKIAEAALAGKKGGAP